MPRDVRHAHKLEALGRIAAEVAHDFNNLLLVILGSAQLLKERLEDEGVALDEVNDIICATDSAMSLTRQLLAFVQRREASLEPIDLTSTLADLEPLLKRVAGPSTELSIEIPDSLPAVLFERSGLTQVLVNLVANARDAMPYGGAATISAHVEPPHVRLLVRDEGVGMDELTRARVFDPFFTTKQGGAGTGLGLAIVNADAERNGARIELESAPGAGTTVSLILRAAFPPPR